MSPLKERLGQVLGAPVRDLHPVAGGDINQAFAAKLSDGRRVFVKHHPEAPPGLFAAEARGLAFLAQPRVLRVPDVLATGDDFLVLELIDSRPRASTHDEALGRGLAQLHAFGAPGFGLDHDNFIGRLEQCNAPTSTWAEFMDKRQS